MKAGIASTKGKNPMAYIVDVKEPWIGEGYSTYDVEACAELQGLKVQDWLIIFRQATDARGGRIVYEGDPGNRPQSLQDEFDRLRETT